MSTILYGISNCDTVRKARRWLDAHHVAYSFHDVRKDGLERKTLHGWIAELGWENLLNRRGTTWRSLPQEVRDGIDPRLAEHQASVGRIHPLESFGIAAAGAGRCKQHGSDHDRYEGQAEQKQDHAVRGAAHGRSA